MFGIWIGSWNLWPAEHRRWRLQKHSRLCLTGKMKCTSTQKLFAWQSTGRLTRSADVSILWTMCLSSGSRTSFIAVHPLFGFRCQGETSEWNRASVTFIVFRFSVSIHTKGIWELPRSTGSNADALHRWDLGLAETVMSWACALAEWSSWNNSCSSLRIRYGVLCQSFTAATVLQQLSILFLPCGLIWFLWHSCIAVFAFALHANNTSWDHHSPQGLN